MVRQLYYFVLYYASATWIRRLKAAIESGAAPVQSSTPEDITRVLDYQLVQPTPEAAPFDGMYCRGGSCQYRVPPPPITIAPTPLVPVVYPANYREFCRGLACKPGAGLPSDLGATGFLFNCAHLYNDVAGGLAGQNGRRSLADVKMSFFKWCKLKFLPQLHGACEGLGDVIIMGMHGSAESPDVGGVHEICYSTYLFITFARTAMLDLRLLRQSLPKVPALVQEDLAKEKRFLPSFLAVGGGDVGPESPRGRAWRREIGEDESRGGRKGALLMLQPDPPNKPDYDQSPPCMDGLRPKTTKVQILDGVPPVEQDQDLIEFCSGTFSEIMAGFAQTGEMVVAMTGDWCGWQSAVTSWVGRQAELGHPEWDHRRCTNMKNFVAFALRNDLQAGLGPTDVCARIYLAIGAIEWHDQAIADAWAGPIVRGTPAMSLSTSDTSEALKKLMKEVSEYANNLYGKLREQKEMSGNLNGAKMDTSSFNLLHKKPASTRSRVRLRDVEKTFSELDS